MYFAVYVRRRVIIVVMIVAMVMIVVVLMIATMLMTVVMVTIVVIATVAVLSPPQSCLARGCSATRPIGSHLQRRACTAVQPVTTRRPNRMNTNRHRKQQNSGGGAGGGVRQTLKLRVEHRASTGETK